MDETRMLKFPDNSNSWKLVTCRTDGTRKRNRAIDIQWGLGTVEEVLPRGKYQRGRAAQGEIPEVHRAREGTGKKSHALSVLLPAGAFHWLSTEAWFRGKRCNLQGPTSWGREQGKEGLNMDLGTWNRRAKHN
jgi:hypothetical protein